MWWKNLEYIGTVLLDNHRIPFPKFFVLFEDPDYFRQFMNLNVLYCSNSYSFCCTERRAGKREAEAPRRKAESRGVGEIREETAGSQKTPKKESPQRRREPELFLLQNHDRYRHRFRRVCRRFFPIENLKHSDFRVIWSNVFTQLV